MSITRSTGHANVRSYRERMRARVCRQIQVWVPDTRSPEFVAECRRQSLLVGGGPTERELINELKALQDTSGWCS